jgi:Glycosyl hydrolases family 28
VKISGVIFKNISGTSKSPAAMKFACSDTVPCSDIVLNDINLERENGITETYCNCAMGIDYGVVRPPADCLKSSACGGGDKIEENKEILSTEL